MLMVISPAKTLDYETPPATQRFTQPQYLDHSQDCLLYTSPSPRDGLLSRMPSSA